MIVQSSTGSGKTIMQAALLLDPIRQLMLYHRRVILDQTARVLENFGIPYGFRCAGLAPNPSAPIQLGMIQTEVARSFRTNRQPLHDAQRVMVDEGHAIKGDTAITVANAYNRRGASVIYFTATPVDMGDNADECHVSTTVPALIDDGYLVPPKVFAIEQPNPKLLAKLRRDSKGEYLASDVAKLVRPDRIKGRVLQHYVRLNPNGSPFILFAHSVATSLYWAQYFTGQGIPTAHICGKNVWVDGRMYKSDTQKRQEVFDRIRSGDLLGLTNRFVLREGLDLPCVSHAILTSPVGSRMSFVQMCGRVLRPSPNKHYAIIQDHSGTVNSHPALDADVAWDWWRPAGVSERVWIDKLRNDKEPEPITCPKCNFQRYAGDTCPECGYRFATHARYVQEADGTLRLVRGKLYRPRYIVRQPNSQSDWERAYWGAYKNSPHRTFEQVYTYYAVTHDWKWLPRDLRYMPKNEYLWYMPVGEVALKDLIGENK